LTATRPGWLQENAATYLSNAIAQRDFRVQFRGNRSLLVFGVFVFTLISIALLYYLQTSLDRQTSVAAAQSNLQMFYRTVMWSLAGLVCVITPALSATAVVAERQRRSLDLMMSAPVHPKYYLVGKMVSSYRYTWMLLALALPITAASVVLGGAAWNDVLAAYFLLSIHALVFSAFSLFMSTIAPKPTTALTYSYLGIFMYVLVTAFASAALIATRMMGMGAASREQPFIVGLNPFSVIEASNTYTMIAGHAIPNYVIVAVVGLLLTRLFLFAAGSVLSPYGGSEVRGLRMYGLALLLAFAVYVGSQLGGFTTSASMSSFTSNSYILGMYVFWIGMLGLFLLPSLVCYGYDAERRYRPTGTMNWLRMFDGTPGGGLPYLWMCVGVLTVGMAIGLAISNFTVNQDFLLPPLLLLGVLTLFAGIGQVASAALAGVRTARAVVIGSYLILLVMPLALISAFFRDVYQERSAWFLDVYLLAPMVRFPEERWMMTLAYGVGSLIVGLTMSLVSQRILSSRRPIPTTSHVIAA
jgi:ABC-type transport system involved in multi-copper enzyme maturation permease subunit